jgi:hypothetical protein
MPSVPVYSHGTLPKWSFYASSCSESPRILLGSCRGFETITYYHLVLPIYREKVSTAHDSQSWRTVAGIEDGISYALTTKFCANIEAVPIVGRCWACHDEIELF